MKTASTILLIAASAAVLAAVWAPGAWWQWAITAVMLLIAGASTGGTAAEREALQELAQAEQEADKAQARARSPHPGIEAAAEEERARLGLPSRPTYGKPSKEADQ